MSETPRTAAPRPVHHCETCGAEVRVISAEDGTSYYQPVAEAARQVTELRAAVEALRQALALADSMLHSGEAPKGHAEGVIHTALNEARALLAGDKAEAPRHSLDGVTALDGGTVTPEDVAYVRRMQAEAGDKVETPTSSGKRVRAEVCPVCDGTVLAPESLHAHIAAAHPEAILPNGETVDEAIARLDEKRKGDQWRAGWNDAMEWLESEPMAPRAATDPQLVTAMRTIEGTLDDIIRFAEAANAPEQSAFATVRVAQLVGMKDVAARALLSAGDKAEAPRDD